MKRPAFQFYPADWRKDSALQSCSLTAQGLWVNIMCIAHECEPYGHLSVNGKPMTQDQLARLVGLTGKECGKLLKELEDAGVFSRTEAGEIFSRRMVADERLRNIRAEAGRLGGNPNLLGNKVNQKDNQTSNQIDKQSPTPSSSSSSSSSEKQKTRAAASRLAVMPEGFSQKVWDDFLAIRTKKRAPFTDTALEGLDREAQKAGITLEAALRTCCERGWQGFKAEWLGPSAPDYSQLQAQIEAEERNASSRSSAAW